MKFIIFHLLASLLSPLAAAAPSGKGCGPDFAGTERPKYQLNEADLKRIELYCQGQTESNFINVVPALPPEFFLYLAYGCAGSRRSDFSLVLKASLDKSWNRYGPEADGAFYWKKVRNVRADFAGVPPEMKARWKEHSLREYQQAKEVLPTQLATMENQAHFLVKLKLAMPFLDESEIKDAIRTLASQKAANTVRQYPGFYEPKVFQFFKQALRRDLGLDYVDLNDFMHTKSRNHVSFSVVSVDGPAAGDSDWLNGLSYKNVDLVEIPAAGEPGMKFKEGAYAWHANGRDYEARYSLTSMKDANDLAPNITRPDYEAFWADKKLTGAIFPGQNMGVGEAGAHDVMNEYRAFYEDRGFKFGKPKGVPAYDSFLEEEIKSGRLDFAVKEAHAQGGDGDIVKLTNSGKIVTGTKKTAGKEEVVHLFYPDEEKILSGSLRPLQYDSVAQWMKAREQAGGKQLLFLDASCSGIGVGCRLASAAQTKNLIVIGSSNSLDTFTNSRGSSMYHLLEGFREKKSFLEMREAMMEGERAGDGVYLLPGSAEWRKEVYGEAPRSADVKVEVFENGKKVDIETVGR